MVGDLIFIFIFAIIWMKLIKLKRNNFREFICEFFIYFVIFCFVLIFYKFLYEFLSAFFDFGLFPSVVGVFCLSFVSLYLPARSLIFIASRKGFISFEFKEKTIDQIIKFADFLIPSMQDFEKAFMVFFAINLVIIASLFNSLADVFTNQKILSYKVSAQTQQRADRLTENTEGSGQAINNLSKTLAFLKATDPKAYEKVISNTERFIFSRTSISPALAKAQIPQNYIIIDPVFDKPFNSLEDEIYFATILVHETEHIKNLKDNDGFMGAALNESVLKLKCNPITNYQYFSNTLRAIYMYNDEWCAQISEVKFLRQFNVDYTENFMKYFEDN